jgi:hypothetical protein
VENRAFIEIKDEYIDVEVPLKVEKNEADFIETLLNDIEKTIVSTGLRRVLICNYTSKSGNLQMEHIIRLVKIVDKLAIVSPDYETAKTLNGIFVLMFSVNCHATVKKSTALRWLLK